MSFFALLLFGLGNAFSMEAVSRPAPTPTREGECIEAIPSPNGSVSPCDGILVPPAELADLMADREWAHHLRDRYELDTAALEWQVSYLQVELATAKAGVPFLQRPSTHVLFGVGGGMLMTVAGAWALAEVGQ